MKAKKKLLLKKFTISKLSNLKKIMGGAGNNNGTQDGGGDETKPTIVDPPNGLSRYCL